MFVGRENEDAMSATIGQCIRNYLVKIRSIRQILNGFVLYVDD